MCIGNKMKIEKNVTDPYLLLSPEPLGVDGSCEHHIYFPVSKRQIECAARVVLWRRKRFGYCLAISVSDTCFPILPTS